MEKHEDMGGGEGGGVGWGWGRRTLMMRLLWKAAKRSRTAFGTTGRATQLLGLTSPGTHNLVGGGG